MNKVLICLLAIFMVATISLAHLVNKLHDERNRYKSNQSTLLDKIEFYQTESGKNAATIRQLTLTCKELEHSNELIRKTADELNIAIKRIKSTTTTVANTNMDVVAVVKDSIVFKSGAIDSIRAFQWRDPWTNISGCIDSDSVALSVNSSDTLVQIVHRVPHKFWFIKWGTKAIRQEVVSSNPHTKITYSDYIEIK